MFGGASRTARRRFHSAASPAAPNSPSACPRLGAPARAGFRAVWRGLSENINFSFEIDYNLNYINLIVRFGTNQHPNVKP